MPLKPGGKAPDFTLLDQNGEPFSLKKSLKDDGWWHQMSGAMSSTVGK